MRPVRGIDVVTKMVFDEGRQRIVLFGGWNGASMLNDVWEWDGAAWTPVHATSPAPEGRAYPGLAYDAARHQIVLYGGQRSTQDCQQPQFTDTWTLSATVWQHVADGGPSGRTSMVMSYDPQRERVVLFSGGLGCGIAPADTWEWDGTRWAGAQDPGRAAPSSRAAAAMTYDLDNRRLFLFGGWTSNGAAEDTWHRQGTVWTQLVAPGPEGRYLHVMAYDAEARLSLLFSGQGSSGPLDDTWAFDGSVWWQLAGAGPAGRAGGAMAYDPVRQQVVLYGGGPNGQFGDTWIWGRYDQVPGNLNCDAAVDFADINPFVLALSDPAGYAAAFPDCSIMNADCNRDGHVDFRRHRPVCFDPGRRRSVPHTSAWDRAEAVGDQAHIALAARPQPGLPAQQPTAALADDCVTQRARKTLASAT